MDEKKLGELFKDAVRDTPPATFGTGEVRRASVRASARHRQNVVVGCVLAVVLLGGGGITAVALTGGTSHSNAAVSASGGSADTANSGTMKSEAGAGAPRVQEAPPTALNDQTGTSKQGDSPPGGAGSPSTRTPSGGCETADRELAAALASELPAAPNAKDAMKVPFGCPPRSRGASFKVTDGARSGTVSLVVIPPGVSAGFAPLGIEVPGTQDFSATGATSGATVYLVSQPTPELAEAPFTENGSQMVARLAQKF